MARRGASGRDPGSSQDSYIMRVRQPLFLSFAISIHPWPFLIGHRTPIYLPIRSNGRPEAPSVKRAEGTPFASLYRLLAPCHEGARGSVSTSALSPLLQPPPPPGRGCFSKEGAISPHDRGFLRQRRRTTTGVVNVFTQDGRRSPCRRAAYLCERGVCTDNESIAQLLTFA